MYDWIVLENYKTHTICLNFSYLHCLVSKMKENRFGVLSNGWFLLSLPPTAIIASMCTHFPQSMQNCKNSSRPACKSCGKYGEKWKYMFYHF